MVSNKPASQGLRYAKVQDKGQWTQRPQLGVSPAPALCGVDKEDIPVKWLLCPQGTPPPNSNSWLGFIHLNSTTKWLECIPVANLHFFYTGIHFFKQNLKQNTGQLTLEQHWGLGR